MGVLSLLLKYVSTVFWAIAAERQLKAMRLCLLKSILRQDIGWFDQTKSGLLSSLFNEYENNFI